MERLEGQTLSELMRGGPPLGAEDEVVNSSTQVGAGITAAAVAGIVHRDLKTAERLPGSRHVEDSRLRRRARDGSRRHAHRRPGRRHAVVHGARAGERRPVDHRTDLYALAAIAYRAIPVTRRLPPASRRDALQVVHTRRGGRASSPELPPEIDLVLAIGMAKRRRLSVRDDRRARDCGARPPWSARLGQAARARGDALVQADAWASSLKLERRAAQ